METENAFVNFVLVVTGLLLGVFFFLMLLIIRYRRKKKENETLREEFSRQLAASRLEMQEQTLQYFARELHDNIGQVASLVKVYLNNIRWNDKEHVEARIGEAKNLVNILLADIKSLSSSLNADKLTHIDLVDAVRAEANLINKTEQFNAQVTVDGTPRPIDPDKKVIVFRMIQEIMTNMVKHSSAENIHINFSYEAQQLVITVQDNGRGFNVAEMMQTGGKGNGLMNLQSRTLAIQGHLEIESVLRQGTTTKISIPLQKLPV